MHIAGLSEVGRVRARNEDAIGWDERAAVATLADGMGGHPAGDVASRLAVDTVLESVAGRGSGEAWLAGQQDVAGLVRRANAAVIDYAGHHPDCRGMGTTLLVAAFNGRHAVIGHVGDSRAYAFRDGSLEQLTTDHTAAQQAIEQQLLTPEQARHSPEHHQLTRALGLEDRVEVDVIRSRTDRGDLFLLCSDGLSDMLDETAMAEVLNDNGHDIDRAARLLVRLALERGGVDNVSVVIVHV